MPFIFTYEAHCQKHQVPIRMMALGEDEDGKYKFLCPDPACSQLVKVSLDEIRKRAEMKTK